MTNPCKKNNMGSQTYFIKTAMFEAVHSKIRSKHGCVIIYNGSVIGKGCNKYRHSGNIPTYINKNGSLTVHAEMAALYDMHRRGWDCKKILPKSTLIVVRIPNELCSTDGTENFSFDNCKDSKPCGTCQKVLNKWNTGCVYHS